MSDKSFEANGKVYKLVEVSLYDGDSCSQCDGYDNEKNCCNSDVLSQFGCFDYTGKAATLFAWKVEKSQ